MNYVPIISSMPSCTNGRRTLQFQFYTDGDVWPEELTRAGEMASQPKYVIALSLRRGSFLNLYYFENYHISCYFE
jgi:hypothetical protein